MQIIELEGARISGICSCLPARSENNLERCTKVYGDEKKALSIVKATGIKSRRIVGDGVSSLDLCVTAADELLLRYAESKAKTLGVVKKDIGSVVNVTFTPARTMPCNACQAQRRLELPDDILAFDINLACSGYAYGLYCAGMLAKSTNKSVLLLDGDTQTPYMNPSDIATVPVMADAGTATLVEPGCDGAESWKFSFLTKGSKGDALTLPFGGKITMDGLGIFKFVTMDVLYFLRDFMGELNILSSDLNAFVPHQANIFMIQQISKKLGFPPEKLWVSGDVLGNSSSATVPTTIAYCGKGRSERGRMLISGFGGGLSASAGLINITSDCLLEVCEYGC